MSISNLRPGLVIAELHVEPGEWGRVNRVVHKIISF